MSFTEFVLSVAVVWLVVGFSERVVLVRAPADALAGAGRDGDFDLIVVGSRGRGASRAVLGSVASHLARGVGILILLGDNADARGSTNLAEAEEESGVR